MVLKSRFRFKVQLRTLSSVLLSPHFFFKYPSKFRKITVDVKWQYYVINQHKPNCYTGGTRFYVKQNHMTWNRKYLNFWIFIDPSELIIFEWLLPIQQIIKFQLYIDIWRGTNFCRYLFYNWISSKKNLKQVWQLHRLKFF